MGGECRKKITSERKKNSTRVFFFFFRAQPRTLLSAQRKTPARLLAGAVGTCTLCPRCHLSERSTHRGCVRRPPEALLPREGGAPRARAWLSTTTTTPTPHAPPLHLCRVRRWRRRQRAAGWVRQAGAFVCRRPHDHGRAVVGRALCVRSLGRCPALRLHPTANRRPGQRAASTQAAARATGGQAERAGVREGRADAAPDGGNV